MKYSAKKAAEAVGKSVPTITRAIKSGKLSAQKNKSGGYSIDPSELFRVYPPVGNVTDNTLPPETPKKLTESAVVTPKVSSEIGLLKEQIKRIDEMNAREVTRLEEQIADLRRDRDKWHELADKQADTVKLLTHQQEKPLGNAEDPYRRFLGIPVIRKKTQA